MTQTIFDQIKPEHKDAWMSWGLDRIRQNIYHFESLDQVQQKEVMSFLLENYGKEIVYLDSEVEWRYIYGSHEYEHSFKRSAQASITKACITFTSKIIEEAGSKMKRLD